MKKSESWWSFFGSYCCSWQRTWLWASFFILLLGQWISVRFALMMNVWNRDFFDAIRQKQWDSLAGLVTRFLGLCFVIIVLIVGLDYFRQVVLLKVRINLIEKILKECFREDHPIVWLQEKENEVDHPDQRIAVETERFVNNLCALVMSAFESLLTVGTFSIVLWELSTQVQLSQWTFHGYLFWIALVYSFVASGITHWIGRTMRKMSQTVQEQRANLRTSLWQVQRNAQAIVGGHGSRWENIRLQKVCACLQEVTKTFLRKKRDLDFFTVGLGEVTHTFPLFISLPALVAGQLSLGMMMQVRGAFIDVTRSFSWWIFAYDQWITLMASYERLNGLMQALHENPCEQKSKCLRGSNLVFIVHDKKVKLTDQWIQKGITQLVGPSGQGKSTALKRIFGLGSCLEKYAFISDRIYWVPQKLYLFAGTLRENLLYANDTAYSYQDRDLQDLLRRFGLKDFMQRLDEKANWGMILSGGEQARIVMIRAMLSRAQYILLDEITASLEREQAKKLLSEIKVVLPESVILLVSHQRHLGSVIDRTISLQRRSHA